MMSHADMERVAGAMDNLGEAPAPDEANETYSAQLRAVLAKLGFPSEYV